jgi:hypothetical protein
VKRYVELVKTELFLDKFVDLVLVFIGLYAAIAVQKWQEDVKDNKEYKRLLRDFRDELQANQGRRAGVEETVGGIDERAPGKALGGLQVTFDEYLKGTADAITLLSCVEPMLVQAPRKGRKASKAPAPSEACRKLLAEVDKNGEGDEFRPVDLAPRYRTDVHQLYLANGIKVFENKGLAVKLSEAYSRARTIESGLAEVERLYNDTFMQKIGEQEAIEGQLEEVVSHEGARRSPGDVREKLASVADNVRTQRYVVMELRKVLEAKVVRIKDLLGQADDHLGKVIAEVDKELEAK